MPAWLTQDKQAQNMIGAAWPLPVGGLGFDTVHLKPGWKFGAGEYWETEMLLGFNCLLQPPSVCVFCKPLKALDI